MTAIAQIAKPSPFSSQVQEGITFYKNNIGQLEALPQKIEHAERKWTYAGNNFNTSTSQETLEALILSEAATYQSFRNAKDKADQVAAAIAFCSNPPIDELTYQTLEQLGCQDVTWFRKGEALQNQMIPGLKVLLDRVEAAKKSIHDAKPKAGSALNNLLFKVYSQLGRATFTNSVQGILYKPYLDKAIEELKQHTETNGTVQKVDPPIEITEEQTTPEGEVNKLQTLLEEIQNLGQNVVPIEEDQRDILERDKFDPFESQEPDASKEAEATSATDAPRGINWWKMITGNKK